MAKLKTRARIFVLVILAALPALLLTVYSAIERRASTENQARAELGRLVKLAAMQQWQVVEGARQMMVASSQILFTLLNDRRRCTEYFASLLAQNRETYHSMGLFRSDGQLFLPRELVRCRRSATPVAVMLIDLDHFKRVNDSFGHEAGDIVLKTIAALLKGKVRGSDIACRYGGEEFALILPETSLDAALRRAEDIRLAIARLGLSYAGTPLGKITASLGIALFPDHGEDTDALLRVADMALYAAKGAGRDRVVAGSVEKR